MKRYHHYWRKDRSRADRKRDLQFIGETARKDCPRCGHSFGLRKLESGLFCTRCSWSKPAPGTMGDLFSDQE